MTYAAGMLSDQITIQVDSSTAPNNQGEQVPTWTGYHTPWCDVEQLSGAQAFRNGQDVSKRTVAFKTHYSDTMLAVRADKYRIVWGGINWDVTSVDPRRDHGEIVVIAVARGPNV